MKIGLLSDTHNYLDPAIEDLFEGVDEIWHAGDFGDIQIAESLRTIAPLIGVFGNIDGRDIRDVHPLHQRFTRQGLDVWITHIGGVPGRYSLPIRQEIMRNPPDLFICGHSHILKVARDPQLGGMIFMNPGAAGRQGFQTTRTVLRFEISDAKVGNLEVIHLDA